MENQESFGMENRSVKEASVEGVQQRTVPKKRFVFCVKVTWSDGTVNLVYRRYSEFLHLQTILYQAFPNLLGRPGSKRTNFHPLPDTFSSRMNVGETIFRRMEQVNYFLKEVLTLEKKVSQSKYIKSFLTPTHEDLEPKQQLPRKGRFQKTSKRRGSNFSKTMKGRLQKFGRTKMLGNSISSPIVLEHFVVMDDYRKQAKSDINLKKGKIVDVIEKRECGWWLIDADGEVGWAPALFLEPADDMSDSEVSNVQKYSIGRGEVFVTTKRYVAAEDDELTFDIGVNLQILEKNFDGWWKASYLGREGWVPQMYLKKLGNDRRNSKTARRKSRLFSTNQLRSPIEEEDEEIQEIPEEEAVDKTDKEDKKMSLPRKISQSVLSAMGKKDSKARHVGFAEEAEYEIDSGQTKKVSRDESKTIDTMVEMSNVFLQLHKNEKGSSNASARPRTPESLPRNHKVSEPLTNSPARPKVQRRAVSTLVPPTFDLGSTGGNHKGSKDDLELDKSRSRSLESMVSSKPIQNLNGGYNSAVESKWKPQTKTALSLPCVHEIPESEQNEIEDGSSTQLNLETPNVSDELPPSSEVSNTEDMEAPASLETAEDSDTGSCDISFQSVTSTELAESLDGFCKQPVGNSTYFKKNSLGEDPPKFQPPKRSPPVPSKVSQSAIIDSPKTEATRRSPPVLNSNSTYPRGKMPQPEDEQHKNHTMPKSAFDRKIIREDTFENETAQHLNEEITFWSSTDESDSELAQLSFNRVLQPKTGTSPAIVVDETEDHFTGEKNRLALDDDIRSTESFEIECNLQNSFEPPDEEDYSTNIYCTATSHEVDAEMYLNKGDYVKVIERASTGFWLVQTDEGLRGWTSSSLFYPVRQVNGNFKSSAPEEEEGEDEDEDEDDEYNPHMLCRVIDDYEADEDNQEINLREGEIMKILQTNENGWWCVRNEEGEIGWAPSNYLEVLEDDF